MLLFLFAGLAWSWMVWQHRATAHQVHYLMIALVAFKTLTLLSQVRTPPSAIPLACAPVRVGA